MVCIFPAFFDYPFIYRGLKNISGIDIHEILVKLPMGGEAIYYIDEESYLITKRFIKWDDKSESKYYEQLITNYIDYEKFKYPDGYVFVGRDGMEKGYYKNVRINVKIDSKGFTIHDYLM